MRSNWRVTADKAGKEDQSLFSNSILVGSQYWHQCFAALNMGFFVTISILVSLKIYKSFLCGRLRQRVIVSNDGTFVGSSVESFRTADVIWRYKDYLQFVVHDDSEQMMLTSCNENFIWLIIIFQRQTTRQAPSNATFSPEKIYWLLFAINWNKLWGLELCLFVPWIDSLDCFPIRNNFRTCAVKMSNYFINIKIMSTSKKSIGRIVALTGRYEIWPKEDSMMALSLWRLDIVSKRNRTSKTSLHRYHFNLLCDILTASYSV